MPVIERARGRRNVIFPLTIALVLVTLHLPTRQGVLGPNGSSLAMMRCGMLWNSQRIRVSACGRRATEAGSVPAPWAVALQELEDFRIGSPLVNPRPSPFPAGSSALPGIEEKQAPAATLHKSFLPDRGPAEKELQRPTGPAISSISSPEEVIRMLLQVAGPGAGIPPPEVVGTALMRSGVLLTEENVIRALKEAAGNNDSPPVEAVRIALAAGNSDLVPAGATGAEARSADTLRGPTSKATGLESPTPEDAVRALMETAGPGAGVPPPEIVGAALRALKVPPSVENVARALKAAGGPEARAPSPSEVATALAAATADDPPLGNDAATRQFSPPGTLSSRSPEEVIQTLRAAAGPGAGTPPPEIVGVALKTAMVPLTIENIVRALVAAAGPGAEPPSADAVAAAMAAASADSTLLDGTTSARKPLQADLPAAPSPEEVIRLLRKAAGMQEGTPPPDVVGMALRKAGVRTTPENIIRALKEASGPGGEPPSPESVAAAALAAAGIDNF